MKQLLAVSWEMPPMYGPRATQVSRTLGALVRIGWQPTVVCLDPRRHGPHWVDGVSPAIPPGVGLLRVASPEEWTIVRAVWRLAPWLRDRPDSKWVWMRRASAAAVEASRRTECAGLVSFAQPFTDHLVGLHVHRTTKLPWVAHFSDPWIDSPYWRGSASRRAVTAKMEAAVIREADAVVFVTDEAAELVMRKYPSEWRRKVAVVPHGFSAPAPKGPTHDNSPALKARAPKDRTGALSVVYTGRFYDGVRTPLGVLRALATLNEQEALAGVIEVSFVGPFVTGFARDAKALGVQHLVRFSDKVPAADAQAIAANADVLLVIDAASDGPSPFLPSKLVDYLPLRKPILGITPVDGASAALIRRIGGIVVAPDDDAGIRIAIRDLLNRWRAGELSVGSGFDRVAAEYDIANTTAAFSDVLTRAFHAAR